MQCFLFERLKDVPSLSPKPCEWVAACCSALGETDNRKKVLQDLAQPAGGAQEHESSSRAAVPLHRGFLVLGNLKPRTDANLGKTRAVLSLPSSAPALITPFCLEEMSFMSSCWLT